MNEVKLYNKKLQEMHGKSIKVKIKSFYDNDDDNTYYYYVNKYGESDYYETPEQAYEAADDYLTNIDLYM